MGLAFPIYILNNIWDGTGEQEMSDTLCEFEKYPNVRQHKKINFLQRWFDRMCRESWERAQHNPVRPVSVGETAFNSDGLSNGLNIQLYGAVGGQIVEFRKYDRLKDHNHVKLYIINSEQNFSEELAKIVSLEMLR
jgi:hypothetical protein